MYGSQIISRGKIVLYIECVSGPRYNPIYNIRVGNNLKFFLGIHADSLVIVSDLWLLIALVVNKIQTDGMEYIL